MSDERIELDVTLRDQASAGLHDIADEAAKVEKVDPEVTVTADTDPAKRELKDVGDTATRLEQSDTVVKIRAQIDDFKAQLKQAETGLGDVADKADDTNRHLDKLGGDGGLHTRGQAIADLTGPLGDASGAASDFAGVFDGISDIASDVAGKVGISAAAMETAIGGIGIAIAAAAAIWTYFSGEAEKAKKRQKELVDQAREFNKALAEGRVEDFAAKLVEHYGDAFNAGQKLGLSVEDTTQLLIGQRQSFEDLNAAIGDGTATSTNWVLHLQHANDAYNDGEDGLKAYNTQVHAVSSAVGGATTKQDALTSSVDATKDAIDRIRGALDFDQAVLNFQSTMDSAMATVQSGAQLSKQELHDVKQAILDAGTAAGLNPIEIQSEIAKVDAGDVAGAYWDTQNKINTHSPLQLPAEIKVNLIRSLENQGLIPKGSSSSAGLSAASSSAGVVNVNLPRGWHGDVMAQVTGNRRRIGGRYGNPVVRYARR